MLMRLELASCYLPVRLYVRAMLFDLQLLGKPDAAGNADVIENRTLLLRRLKRLCGRQKI